MCQWKSGWIEKTDTGFVNHHVNGINSHGELVRRLNLVGADATLFAPYEYTPISMRHDLRLPESWDLKCDTATLPGWWNDALIRAIVHADTMREVHYDGEHFVVGSGSVRLFGSARAVCRDNSRAVCRGNSSAVCWDNSSAVRKSPYATVTRRGSFDGIGYPVVFVEFGELKTGDPK